jgi:hypothetical protein
MLLKFIQTIDMTLQIVQLYFKVKQENTFFQQGLHYSMGTHLKITPFF